MSQRKRFIHILIIAFHQRITVTKRKNAHKFRQAAQLWHRKVVESAIETGPFSLRRFFFLVKAIVM